MNPSGEKNKTSLSDLVVARTVEDGGKKKVVTYLFW
jgi:hypothetical protein